MSAQRAQAVEVAFAELGQCYQHGPAARLTRTHGGNAPTFGGM